MAAVLVRDIPDYPQAGVVFRDITPLLGDAEAFGGPIDELVDRFIDVAVDRVVGIEARGSSSPLRSPTGSGRLRPGAQGRQAAVGRRPRGVRARVRHATSWRSTATPSTPTSAS